MFEVELPDLPSALQHMPSPPERLFVKAASRETFAALLNRPRVAIVGTRRITAYGNSVTSQIATELAAQGVVIVSGLALGVDGVAHLAALNAGGLTMAILPSPVDQICPPSHQRLAQRIIDNGGALVSEYPSQSAPFKQNFIARNRIVTAISDGLLITEATINSGTMHTARFALGQGKEVLAVPGNATSLTSEGTNNLIRSGAALVTSAKDVLLALNLTPAGELSGATVRVRGANRNEQAIISLLEQGINDGAELLRRSGFDVTAFNHHLTMLELTAKVRALGANRWALA